MSEDGGGPDRASLRGEGVARTSLAGTLGQRLARLVWRSPIHRMRLRGRYPLQLIDVPADPVPGRAKAGRALLAGRMLLDQEEVTLKALDRGGYSPAFFDHLQSFAWLRDLAVVSGREEGAEIAEALTRSWLAKHARVGDAAWRPDLWGRRILLWSAYAPYLIGGQDHAYRGEVLNAFARGARHLDRASDGVPPGLPRVAAWAGVIAAGLLIPGGDLRVSHGEVGIARALAQALHDDGGLGTRMPAMQLDLIELLVQLRAVYEVRARPMPGAITRSLAIAVPALAGVRLGDGALSSWQGRGPLTAGRIDAAIAASGVRSDPLDRPRDWGYQRLVAGEAILVIDAAPPPPGASVKGGCASTLAFELSDARHRLIVNCGGGGGLAPDLAAGLRTTAAHSTLCLADTNSTALHDDGSLGRGVTEVEMERVDAHGAPTIEAAHDGYVRRHGFRHARRLRLTADGRQLSGEDRMVPAGRRRGLAATPFAIRFHLAPGLDPVLTADGRGALIKPREGHAWQFRSDGGTLSLEDSMWIDGLGRAVPTQALAIAGESPPDGAAIGWSWRRVR